MPALKPPSLPLPAPLRAAERDTFTEYSVVVRLKNIAGRTLTENDFPAPARSAIQALIDGIPDAPIRAVDTPLAADAALWEAWVQPYLGQDWREPPWFFIEEYFYRRILEATGYFHPGAGLGRDPYRAQKRLGLTSSAAAVQEFADHLNSIGKTPLQDTLARLLLLDLWGNQNDLSMWPVDAAAPGDSEVNPADPQTVKVETSITGLPANPPLGADLQAARPAALPGMERVLSNDLNAVVTYITGLPENKARIDLLLDNAGYELVADLALADALLSTRRAAQVVLHSKTHPVFVSDALKTDINDTLDFLSGLGGSPAALAARLRTAQRKQRLLLRAHPFWTSPLAAWDMPAELADDLAQSALLLSKGDANYRRLLGDRHWPFDLPFARVVDYFPCPMLALRTMKSEIGLGLDAAVSPQNEADWKYNGRWALLQFAP